VFGAQLRNLARLRGGMMLVAGCAGPSAQSWRAACCPFRTNNSVARLDLLHIDKGEREEPPALAACLAVERSPPETPQAPLSRDGAVNDKRAAIANDWWMHVTR
jgi:hypothetical protein